MAKIKALVVGSVHGDYKVGEMMDDLVCYQNIVGGNIEVVSHGLIDGLRGSYDGMNNVVMIVNEEGLLKGLPVNENFVPFFYVGNAIFVGVKDEEFYSLSDQQIANIIVYLNLGI